MKLSNLNSYLTLKQKLSYGSKFLFAAALSFNLVGFSQVHAQSANTSNSNAIVVTGSHIKSDNITSDTPLTVVTSEDIAKSSAVTLEQVLSGVVATDFSGGISSQSNNGGVGASEMSIHNLGASRTLVLLNGQRYVMTDTQGASEGVDLNNIPVGMIDRIEVLKDGASSVYGADAIAGVINIITKKHFDGMEVSSTVGGTSQGDGLKYGISTLIGSDFNRGNILVQLGFDNSEALRQNARDWASAQYIGTTLEGSLGNISSKLPFLTSGSSGWINGNPVSLKNSSCESYATGLVYLPAIGKCYYALSTLPDIAGSLTRKQANMTLHYDVTPDISFMSEAFYTNRKSEQVLNGEPLSSTITTGLYTTGMVIPAAYSTTGQDQNVNLRTNFLGPRNYLQDNDTLHLKFALEGTVLNKFDWNAGYVFGVSNTTAQVENSVNFYHLGQLTGQYPCQGFSGCSVANFYNLSTLTQAQKNYLSYTDSRRSQTEEDFGFADISGPLFNLPAGPVKFDVGVERRNESMYDHPDSIRAAGEADSDAQPTSGKYSVYSTYSEFQIPLLKDMVGVQMLSADLSGRYDYFSTFGDSLTWKAGLNYQVSPDLRFRAGISTGFRAPQVKEIYGGNFQTFPSFSGDPCSVGGAYAGNTACNNALIKAGQVPTTFSSQIQQVAAISGGNTGLKPEKSNDFSVGTVLTPSFVPGLAVSVDGWLDIVNNAIIDGGIGASYPDIILSQCYGQNLASSCSLISRSPTTGEISTVLSPNANYGFEKVRGIDIDVSYPLMASSLGLGIEGKFLFDWSAQVLLSDNVLLPGGLLVHQAGHFNASTGVAEPVLKYQFTTNYSQDNWSLRYAIKVIGRSTALDLGTGSTWGYIANNVVYNNMSATYNITKKTTITLGIDNIFDVNPPVIAGDLSAANTLSNSGYDYLGRYMYLKIKAGF